MFNPTGEHARIFACVTQIYKAVKETLGITGCIPVILVEDETKVKTIVGTGEARYNKIVDTFCIVKIEGFSRVVMVNPLLVLFPQLVLVVSYICNCFNVAWIRWQWNVIDQLWV